MITDTHPTADQLAAFDAGTLPDAARESVERHVAGCETCCRLLEGLPADPLAVRVRAFAAAPPLPEELRDHPRVAILAPIGAGGMGTVYRGVQRQLGRPVAVKVLHRRLTERPGFAERFRRETQALARLNHPNIVQAYDADRAGETHFLVMELVDGESLDAVVRRRGPLPPAEACDLLRQAATGLRHAHEHGLVHRDIKPGNLLLTRDGVVKVADFGLARLVGGEETLTGGSAPTVLGTPEYMAPEQARDPAGADVRADLYSLGCTLYFLLAGRPPFSGASPLQTLLDHQDTAPPPVAGLPAPVAAILDRLLAKERAKRFATPAELITALERVSSPAPPPAPRADRRRLWRGVALGAVVLAGATAAVFALGPRDRKGEPPPNAPVEPAPAAPPEVAVAPPPRAVDPDALATPEQLAALRKESTDRLIGWVRANNRWGDDSSVLTNVTAQVDRSLPRANAFSLALGSDLLRSGRPTLLAARPGGFFEFELTPEQARAGDILPKRQLFIELIFPTEPRRARPHVRLEDFRIDSADDHPADGRLVGSVTCEFAAPAAPGDYLRVTHHRSDGARVMFLHHPAAPPGAGRIVIGFSANPLEPRTKKGDRLVPVFAEWVSRAGEIESAPVATLVLLREKR